MADRAEHRISQQHSLPNSPLLRKRKKIRSRSRPEVYDQTAPVPASPSLTSLSGSSSDSECDSNREEEEDPLPDKDGQAVTVKQALEGLFYNKAVQLVHHHEWDKIILVYHWWLLCRYFLFSFFFNFWHSLQDSVTSLHNLQFTKLKINKYHHCLNCCHHYTSSSYSCRLIIVKRYSHGKTFGQRLAYVLYKHPKTRKNSNNGIRRCV